jgi:hypothetical protein
MEQVLEHAIVNGLHRRKQVRSSADWASEGDQFMGGHFENTVAQLIKAFKQVTTVPLKFAWCGLLRQMTKPRLARSPSIQLTDMERLR